MDTYVKKNHSPYRDQLFCEARGLEKLREFAGELGVPEVLKVDESELRMRKIKEASFGPRGWKLLGAGLARMHRRKGDAFGLGENNYIGLKPQINGEEKNWGRFFLERRLMYQVSIITDVKIKERLSKRLEKSAKKLIDSLNIHSPSPAPAHGDLWSGNVLYDGQRAWLIDPAFYFADREVDIAMTEMFGGFSPAFYEEYNRINPLSDGYGERKTIYNLYHYLNHYNIFGDGYLPMVEHGFSAIDPGL